MASLIARIWTQFHTKHTVSIMIVGLDNSGKTSVLNCLSSLNNQLNNPRMSTTSQQTSRETPRGGRNSAPSLGAGTRNVSVPTDSDSNNILPTVGYNFERLHCKNLTITVLDFSGQNRYRNLWQEFYNCVDGIVYVIDSSDLIRFVVARDELETMLSHPFFSSLSGQPICSDGDSDQSHGGSMTPSESQKQLTISRGKLVQQPLGSDCSSSSNYSQVHFGRNSKCRTKVPILFLANKCDLANSVDTEVLAKLLNLNKLPTSRHPWHIQATSVSSGQGILEGFGWLLSQLSAQN